MQCVCVCVCAMVCPHIQVCLHVCALLFTYLCVCVHECVGRGPQDASEIVWGSLSQKRLKTPHFKSHLPANSSVAMVARRRSFRTLSCPPTRRHCRFKEDCLSRERGIADPHTATVKSDQSKTPIFHSLAYQHTEPIKQSQLWSMSNIWS